MSNPLPGRNYVLAPLDPLSPEDGVGIYETATGCCRYYSDGEQWFFEMAGGKPAFYAAKGALYSADGRQVALDVDISALQLAKSERSGIADYVMSRRRHHGG